MKQANHVQLNAVLQRSLAKINQLQKELAHLREPIAIVGAGLRLPGNIRDLTDLWQSLIEGRDLVSERPIDRRFPETLPEHLQKGAYLNQPERFDAAFFGISPREAASMDPQQRLLLEVSWEALERAQIDPNTLRGTGGGCFVGLTFTDYALRQGGQTEGVDAYFGTGNLPAVASGRLAYFYGLQGPTLSLDTACSSSLVAIHQAVTALRHGQCDLALAGGVNLILSHQYSQAFANANMLAPDGRCKTFDASANGYVRGEGCGLVVLKRLSDAQVQGLPIAAVIHGSAINHDGPSSGLTAPNGLAQQALLEAALRDASLQPEDITYLEAHGTGTALGDPIEVGAIARVHAGREKPLRIGSIKTHIGHLEAAAGMAGLFKLLAIIQARALPGTLHFHQPNPELPLLDGAIEVVTQHTPLDEGPFYAGISSFGVSGTNAHLIVGDPPERKEQQTQTTEPPYLLTLSARAPEALVALASETASLLEEAPLAEVCHALATARAHHPFRHALIVTDANQARDLLQQLAAKEQRRASRPRLTFVYTGQGAQWSGMALDLYEADASFRGTLDTYEGWLQKLVDWSLLDTLRQPEETGYLLQTERAQVAITALQMALTDWWRQHGIEADAVLGHSVGEIAACYAAGVYDAQTALRIATTRGRVMRRIAGRGGMLALGIDHGKALGLIAPYPELSIAAQNDRESVVVSGALDQLDQLIQTIDGEPFFIKRLPVKDAFHSHFCEEIVEELRFALADLNPARPHCLLMSGFRGKEAQPGDFDGEYFARAMRGTVRFHQAMEHLIEQGFTAFLEIGGHPALQANMLRTLSSKDKPATVWGSLRRGKPARATLLASMAELYRQGFDPTWERLFPGATPCIALPTYPWQQLPFWVDVPVGSPSPSFPGAPVQLANHDGWVFETRIDGTIRHWLDDHCLDGQVVFPASAYIALIMAASKETQTALSLTDLNLLRPLFLVENLIIQTQLSPHARGWDCALYATAQGSGEWGVYAKAILIEAQLPQAEEHDLQGAVLDTHTFHEQLAQGGFQYGPSFRRLEAITTREDTRAARLVSEPGGPLLGGVPHPAILDAAFQLLLHLLLEEADEGMPLPASLAKMELYGELGRVSHALARRTGTLCGDVFLLDEANQTLGAFRGLRFVSTSSLLPQNKLEKTIYQLAWQAWEAPPAGPDTRWLVLDNASEEGLCFVKAMGGALLAREEVNADLDIGKLLANHQETPVHVVLACESNPCPDLEQLGQTTLEACQKYLRIFQALLAEGGSIRLTVLTRGAVQVHPDEPAPRPHQAALWGMVRTLAAEHPELDPCLMDLGEDVPAWPQQWPHGEVALREGAYWRPKLVPHQTSRETFTVKNQSSYLITGGTGALGLLSARFLVEHGATHLILTHRGEPTDDVAAHIATLETLGARVVLVRVDLSDPVAFKRQLFKAAISLPPIRGVIHAAGTLADGALLNQTGEHFSRVFETKVRPALQLIRLIAGLELAPDFIAFYGSATSLIGSRGQANYAAANAFMDAFAVGLRQRGLPTMSIAWGPWATTGMAARTVSQSRSWTTGSAGLLDQEQGLTALGTLLSVDIAHAAVLPFDWRRFSESLPEAYRPTVVEHLLHERRSQEAGPIPSLATMEPDQARAYLENHLRTRLAESLGMQDANRLEEGLGFFDQGMDSIVAIEVTQRLSADFGLKLPPTLFFDYPTLTSLFAFLSPKLLPEQEPPSDEPAGDLDELHQLLDQELDLLDNLILD